MQEQKETFGLPKSRVMITTSGGAQGVATIGINYGNVEIKEELTIDLSALRSLLKAYQDRSGYGESDEAKEYEGDEVLRRS